MTFTVVKNKLKDKTADTKQYKHHSPGNLVLRMYKKYALAAAIEVVVPSKTNLPLASSISSGNCFLPNCSPSAATTPYATIPINGSGTPATSEG
nr:hypothetical protein Iba_chr11fCG3340 [Ipomoea batatas]